MLLKGKKNNWRKLELNLLKKTKKNKKITKSQ